MTIPIGFSNTLMSSPVLELHIEPSIGITVKKLAQLDASLKNMRIPLETSIREVMRPSIRTNFDVGGRPKWEALEESTVKRKGNAKILVETGQLRRIAGQLNIWRVGLNTAVVDGAQFPKYAGIHQAGGGERTTTGKNERGKKIFITVDMIVPRPFLLIQEEDKDKIRAIFLEWVELKIGQSWGR